MSYLGQGLGLGREERFTATATAGQTTVTVGDDGRSISYTPNYVDVYLNGSKQVNGSDVTVTSGTSIVFASALTAGDVVDVVAPGYFQPADTVSRSLGGTFLGPVNFPSGGLNVGSGQLRVDSSGRVLKNAQPAFFAGTNANWTHPSGVQKIAASYAAPVNVGGHFDTGTKRFTAPVAGVYLMCATVGTIGGTGDFNYLSSEIWVNGAGRIRGGWDGGGVSYGQTSTSGVVALAAGDYVELYCEANKTFIVEGGNGSATYLSGYLLG